MDVRVDNEDSLAYDSTPRRMEVDLDGPPTALVFNLKEDSPFSFKCQVCSVCCSNKAIQLGPYEALRLARSLGLTTTAFFAKYAEEGGTVLRNTPDGSCIFLESRGCGVHPDRPLVCRLFPLGQLMDERGGVRFAVMPLHPDCLGVVDADGTVRSYLESQGALLYFRYDAAYSAIRKKIIQMRPGPRSTNLARIPSSGAKTEEKGGLSPERLLSLWSDIDAALAACGRAQERERGEDLDELVHRHIEALEEWPAAWLSPPRARGA